MLLACRTLLHQPLRFALSVTGVALALVLMLVLNGLYRGLFVQLSAYLEHSPATLVVSQQGVTGMLGASSRIPTAANERVTEAVAGQRVVPILSQFVVLDLHGRKQPVYLIGYECSLGGGPWSLATGAAPQADDEIVIDRVLAERHDLRVGETIELLARRLRVVGLSTGTTTWVTGLVFVSRPTAEQLLGAPDMTSFLLLEVSAGADLAALRTQLEAIPGIEVSSRSEVIENDARLYARVFSVPLRLMTGIAFAIGALVSGLTIYTTISERRREYGTLKAIGMSRLELSRLVVALATVVAVAGIVVGVPLAIAAGWLIEWLRPQFLLSWSTGSLVSASLAGVLMAVLAAAGPSWLVARMPPSDVFSGR